MNLLLTCSLHCDAIPAVCNNNINNSNNNKNNSDNNDKNDQGSKNI